MRPRIAPVRGFEQTADFAGGEVGSRVAGDSGEIVDTSAVKTTLAGGRTIGNVRGRLPVIWSKVVRRDIDESRLYKRTSWIARDGLDRSDQIAGREGCCESRSDNDVNPRGGRPIGFHHASTHYGAPARRCSRERDCALTGRTRGSKIR